VFAPFTLAATTTIDSVEWHIVYISFNTLANNPVGPTTVTWEFNFYADAAGAPGVLLLRSSLAAGAVTTTYLGANTTLFSTPTNQDRFAAILPADCSAMAATPYWFLVVSLQGADNPLFAWTSSTDPSVNIYKRYYEAPNPPIDYIRGNSVNFLLIDLLEPASLALLTMAVGGLVWSCRRHDAD
jgi:hypothetical protein